MGVGYLEDLEGKGREPRMYGNWGFRYIGGRVKKWHRHFDNFVPYR